MTATRQIDTVALKKAMLDVGLESLQELSDATGVNRNTLGQTLSGKILPSTNVMFALADILKLSPEQAGQIFFAKNLRSA